MFHTSLRRNAPLILLLMMFVSSYVGNALSEISIVVSLVYILAKVDYTLLLERLRNKYSYAVLGISTAIAFSSLLYAPLLNALTSLLLYRFFLAAVIVKILIKKLNEESYYRLQLYVALIALFIAVNTLFQFVVGYDFFGTEYFEAETLTRLTTPSGKMRVGYFLSIAAVFQLALYYFSPNSLSKHGNVRGVIILSLLLCAVGVLLSGERAPFYIMLGTFMVFALCILKREHKLYVMMGLILSFVAALMLFPKVYERHVNTNVAEISGRSSHLSVYQNTVILINESLIFGSGHKTFMSRCNESDAIADKSYCTTHPHNWYLEILYEGGLLAFAFFLYLLITILGKNIKLSILEQPHRLLIFAYFCVKLIPIVPSPSIHAAWAMLPLCMLVGVAAVNKRKA